MAVLLWDHYYGEAGHIAGPKASYYRKDQRWTPSLHTESTIRPASPSQSSRYHRRTVEHRCGQRWRGWEMVIGPTQWGWYHVAWRKHLCALRSPHRNDLSAIWDELPPRSMGTIFTLVMHTTRRWNSRISTLSSWMIPFRKSHHFQTPARSNKSEPRETILQALRPAAEVWACMEMTRISMDLSTKVGSIISTHHASTAAELYLWLQSENQVG